MTKPLRKTPSAVVRPVTLLVKNVVAVPFCPAETNGATTPALGVNLYDRDAGSLEVVRIVEVGDQHVAGRDLPA